MAKPKPELHDEAGLRLLKEMALDIAESAHNELHGEGEMNSRFTPATFDKIKQTFAKKVHRMSELTGKPQVTAEDHGVFHFFRRALKSTAINDEWRHDTEVDAKAAWAGGMATGPDFGGALDWYIEAKDHGDNPPLHGDLIMVIHSPTPGNPDISRIVVIKIGRPPEGGFIAERVPVEEESILMPSSIKLTHDEGAYGSDDQRLISATKVYNRFGYELRIQTGDEGEIVRIATVGGTPANTALFNEAEPVSPKKAEVTE